jgi:hypothetical protein
MAHILQIWREGLNQEKTHLLQIIFAMIFELLTMKICYESEEKGHYEIGLGLMRTFSNLIQEQVKEKYVFILAFKQLYSEHLVCLTAVL